MITGRVAIAILYLACASGACAVETATPPAHEIRFALWQEYRDRLNAFYTRIGIFDDSEEGAAFRHYVNPQKVMQIEETDRNIWRNFFACKISKDVLEASMEMKIDFHRFNDVEHFVSAQMGMFGDAKLSDEAQAAFAAKYPEMADWGFRWARFDYQSLYRVIIVREFESKWRTKEFSDFLFNSLSAETTPAPEERRALVDKAVADLLISLEAYKKFTAAHDACVLTYKEKDYLSAVPFPIE